MRLPRSSWQLVAGALAGVSFAMAVDSIEPHATAQTLEQMALQAAAEATPRQTPSSHAEELLSYAPLVKQSAPAVVNVYTARVVRTRSGDPFWDLFFGSGRMAPQPRTEQSLGSGVIVDASGLVVTNNHVVDGADEILIALADRREFKAKLVFKDRELDLALLRIEPTGKPLPTIQLGDSDAAEVGDIVIAIGNPFGVGQTVTHGIVSALARTGVGISDYQFFIQTDAPINPGNSGGALIGMDGRLVGINTAIFSRSGGSNGVGFAIPSNMVRQFISGAKAGRIARAWLGFTAQPVTADIARGVGLDRPAGVVVNQVTPGSPAARAGLSVGDIVYAVDGKDASDPDTLRYLISSQPVGSSVKLTVMRNGKPQNVVMQLAAPPEVPAKDTTTIQGNNILSGVTIANLSPALAAELGQGLPEQGVVVMSVDVRAPSAQFGLLQPGDLIVALDGKRAENARALQTLAARSGGEGSLSINRGGRVTECIYRAPASIQCRG